MKNHEFKVLFYLKKTARDSAGLCPVMGRITIGHTIAQFSAKLKCRPELWDEHKGRLKGKSAEAVKINRAIERINLSIHKCYKSLAASGDRITAEAVKNGFQGIASVQHTVLKLFSEHNERFAQRVSVDRAQSTYIKFEVSLQHLTNFIRMKYRVSDLPFSRLDTDFIRSFDNYLRIEKRLQPGTVVIILRNLCKIVRIAFNREIISFYPFNEYRFQIPKARPRSISMDEMERITRLPLSLRNQIVSRDLFLFSCWTGISLIDISELTEKDLVVEEDGTRWISSRRHKTCIPYRVRLLSPAIAIIDKYKGQKPGFLFPFPIRGTVIYSMRVIGKKCSLDKKLNFHMGRHTFASQVCLSHGVPIETVSKMLGHTNIDTTQIYAEVSSEKIVNDLMSVMRQVESEMTFIP